MLSLGQKTNIGFYKYEQRNAVPDPKGLEPFIAEATMKNGSPQPISDISNTEIVEMIMYANANEALRILHEGHVVRSSDIDVGSVYGYGFPAYRGGLLKWAEMEGYNKVCVKLNYWCEKYRVPLFQPCDYLKQLAREYRRR